MSVSCGFRKVIPLESELQAFIHLPLGVAQGDGDAQAAQAVLKQAAEKYTFFLTWQRKKGEKCPNVYKRFEG